MGSDPIAWRDEHVGTGGGGLEVEEAKMRDIKTKEVIFFFSGVVLGCEPKAERA